MSVTPPPPSSEPLSEEEEAVARALGRLLMVLPRAMNADLERAQRMSLSEYAGLRPPSERDGRRMRMSELAAACDMSLSGMTRLAGKLESLGFLQRVRGPKAPTGRGGGVADAGSGGV